MTEPKKEVPASAPKKSGIPLDEWSGSGATRELHATVKAFTATSDRQAKTMIGLTWAIFGLTVALVIGLAVQLWLAWAALPVPFILQ